MLRNTPADTALLSVRSIFELQDRSFNAFVTVCLFGLGILLCAPYYAWKWRVAGRAVLLVGRADHPVRAGV